jgi:hypothetical protein
MDTELDPRTQVTGPPQGSESEYERCEHCAAPMERSQRYCVVCGTHRRHVRDPAASYLSTATARTRRSGQAQPRRGAKHSPGLGTALVLAVIPIAVGLGVLVGRASNNGDDKLIAALRAQRPAVVAAGTAGTDVAASASTRSVLKSDFPLQNGYAVQLSTVPRSGATNVKQDETSARAKGAAQVGLILQSDYKITPAPPSGAFVIYSGAYKSQSQAQTALKKLAKSFAGAKVIHVQTTTSGSSSTASTKVLARTPYGVVHQVTGYQPTKSQLAAGGQIVKKVAKTLGKSYVNAQRGLPDVIPVP